MVAVIIWLGFCLALVALVDKGVDYLDDLFPDDEG